MRKVVDLLNETSFLETCVWIFGPGHFSNELVGMHYSRVPTPWNVLVALVALSSVGAKKATARDTLHSSSGT